MYDFNNKALEWDNERRVKRAKIIADKIYDVVEVKKDSSAMEYGCGTGLISFNLADKFDSIVLMDLAQAMIDVLNKKIELSGNKNMKPVLKDLVKEEYNEEKFDLIYNSMVLHHIIDTEKIIKTFYSILNDNGVLCIVDLDKDDGSFHKDDPEFNGHSGFDHEYIANVFRKAGFVNIKIETFYHSEVQVLGETVPYSLFCISGKKV